MMDGGGEEWPSVRRPPKYRVADADPSIGKAMILMSPVDLALAGACSVVSGAWGYHYAWNLRRPTMFAAGIIGGTAGLLLGMQNSYARLLGERE